MGMTIDIRITFSYMSKKLEDFILKKRLPENGETDNRIFCIYETIQFSTLDELPIDLFKDFVKLDKDNSFSGIFSSGDKDYLGGRIIYTAGSDEIEILRYEDSERKNALQQKKELCVGTYRFNNSSDIIPPPVPILWLGGNIKGGI